MGRMVWEEVRLYASHFGGIRYFDLKFDTGYLGEVGRKWVSDLL